MSTRNPMSIKLAFKFVSWWIHIFFFGNQRFTSINISQMFYEMIFALNSTYKFMEKPWIWFEYYRAQIKLWPRSFMWQNFRIFNMLHNHGIHWYFFIQMQF